MQAALIYIRSFVGALFFPFFTVFVALIVMFFWFSEKQQDFWIQFWAKTTLWLFGIKAILHGTENIPPHGQSCLYLFNHTSFFDIFVMQAVIPSFRFGAKIELFKIPIFAQAMRIAGVLPIARGNLRQVIRVYDAAKVHTERGRKYALAPEGTRYFTESLAPFKSGPFIFAINTQIPVVPVVIRGALEILPKHGVLPNKTSWTKQIKVDILPKIETKNIKIEQKEIVQEQVRKAMKVYLKD